MWMNTAANDRQIIEAVREGQRPDMSAIAGVLTSSSDVISDVITRCWAQDPDHRLTFAGKSDQIKSDMTFTASSIC